MIRVELRARGARAPAPRSDALFGWIVWGVRAVFGREAAERLVAPLLEDPPRPSLFLTSCFPTTGLEEGGRSYFPRPTGAGGGWIDEADLLALVASGELEEPSGAPAVERGGLPEEARHRFFLADGPADHFVEPAIRFLERFGMGGDASRGGGAFRAHVADVQFPKRAEEGRRSLLLSVHLPRREETEWLARAAAAGEDVRWSVGRRSGLAAGRVVGSEVRVKPAVPVLEEGSVVPAGPGRAPLLGRVREGGGERAVVFHGCGFFVPLGAGGAA